MIIETIYKELHNAKETRYKIGKATGVKQPTLCKIYNRQQLSLNTETADKLLAYFGYELIKKERSNGDI